MTVPDKSLLFPIGHCLGADYHDLPTSNDHTFRVRVGAEVKTLDDEQFAVWGLAHGFPTGSSEAWGRMSILKAAGRVRGAEQVLDSLVEDHLIVATTPGTEAAVDFARRHRMVPLMLGLGNTAEEPWKYAVGTIGLPLVEMSAMAYDLYEWAHMDPNLWLACEGAAATARRVGIEDPLTTDPLLTLDALLNTLHALLSHNAAYLDAPLAA